MSQRLEDILRSVSDGSTRSRQPLYKSLLESQLILPIETGTPGRSSDLNVTEVSVLCSRDDQGYLSTGVFTSVDLLQKWQAVGSHFVQAPGASVFAIIGRLPIQRVYINWGSEGETVLARWELEALAEGQTQASPIAVYDLPSLGQVKFSRPPADFPIELREDLRVLVQSDFRIGFAYFLQVEYVQMESPQGLTPPPGEGPVLTLVLVAQPYLEDQEIEEAANLIGQRAQDLIPRGRPLDVITLPAQHEILSMVMKTGSVLAVNDEIFHQRVLSKFDTLWRMSA